MPEPPLKRRKYRRMPFTGRRLTEHLPHDVAKISYDYWQDGQQWRGRRLEAEHEQEEDRREAEFEAMQVEQAEQAPNLVWESDAQIRKRETRSATTTITTRRAADIAARTIDLTGE